MEKFELVAVAKLVYIRHERLTHTKGFSDILLTINTTIVHHILLICHFMMKVKL